MAAEIWLMGSVLREFPTLLIVRARNEEVVWKVTVFGRVMSQPLQEAAWRDSEEGTLRTIVLAPETRGWDWEITKVYVASYEFV